MHHENFTRQYDIDFLGLRPHNSVSLGSRTTILSHSFDIPRATLVKHITFTGRATASEAFPASSLLYPVFPRRYRWTAYLPPSYVGTVAPNPRMASLDPLLSVDGMESGGTQHVYVALNTSTGFSPSSVR